MALDGQPSEPFPARNGAVVLAPGGRADVFIDATAAGGHGLVHPAARRQGGPPDRPAGRLRRAADPPGADCRRHRRCPPTACLHILDLKNALRVDLTLGGSPADWVTPARFAATAAPAFRAKAGRAVVLALTNRAAVPTVFHLHGHHFRLLDRLDDGWKPFWLDTLAIEAGQTQRIAFAAEYAGRWLMESMATDWAAPRLVRWYSVGAKSTVSVLDAELVIEPAEHRRQHLRQVFRDQPGAGLARGLAVHPDPDAGGLEGRHALRQQPAIIPGQHVAGAGGGEPGRRVGGDGGAAVRRRHHGIRPLEQHDGAGSARRRPAPVRVSSEVDACC